MNEIEIKQLKKRVYVVLGIIVLALIVFFVFFSRSFSTIKISPGSATLLIDGQLVPLSQSGLVRKSLTPGVHNIKVEANSYLTFIQEIQFKRGFSNSINVALKEIPEPISVNAKGRLLSKGNDFNSFFYLGDNGKTLYRSKIGTDENKKIKVVNTMAITNTNLNGINSIIWSPDKDLALFQKSKETTIFDFMKYDFIHQTENPWGKEIGSIAWSPDNSKIAYYYAPANGEKSLVFSNIANTEINRVLNLKELGIENPILRWSPNSEWVLLVNRSGNITENKIYLFNAYSHKMKTLTETGGQLDAIFSPDGNKILYATYSKDQTDRSNSILSIMNSEGNEAKSLDLRAELGKVAWNNDSRTIIVAGVNSNTNQESIFGFNTQTKEMTDFVFKNDGLPVSTVLPTEDGTAVMYENGQGIFALPIK